LGSEFDVWESRIVDEVRVDEEGELCDTVRDPRRRSRVVGVRVDGDRAATKRRNDASRAARAWSKPHGATTTSSGRCWRTVSHEADLDSIEDLLLRVSQLAEDLPGLAELDLNPVIAGPSGCVIVDSRVRLAQPLLKATLKSW
jgi:hypothetical protein